MAPKLPKRYVVKRADQRKAMGSQVRLEILGAFPDENGSSIAEIAERMSRPATALYYHFDILERAGLVRRVGSRRKGKREQALYLPVASRIEVEATSGGIQDIVKAMSSAFRMAERDMEAALTEERARQTGKYTNFTAARLHFPVSKKKLAEINQALGKVIDLIQGLQKEVSSDDANEHLSLTIALLPLRGRDRTIH